MYMYIGRDFLVALCPRGVTIAVPGVHRVSASGTWLSSEKATWLI